jgi:hypothetical protein
LTAETAEIRDLGHAPYTGPRKPPSRRFWVISRNVVAVAWRSRWGVKLPVILAVGTTLTAAVAMYLLRLRLTETVRARGAPIPQAEAIVFMAGSFYELSGFILALVVGCALIADDLRMGAFQFYFARALRPRDYVVGKLLGLALVIGIPLFLGPVVLAVVRLAYAESLAMAWDLSPVLPRAMLHGLLGTLAYVLPAAGIGAWVGKRQAAQALYAVYVMLVTPLAHALSGPLDLPLLRTLSLSSDLSVLGRAIFGLDHDGADPPVAASAASMVLLLGLALLAVWVRVRRAETSGMGSG